MLLCVALAIRDSSRVWNAYVASCEEVESVASPSRYRGMDIRPSPREEMQKSDCHNVCAKQRDDSENLFHGMAALGSEARELAFSRGDRCRGEIATIQGDRSALVEETCRAAARESGGVSSRCQCIDAGITCTKLHCVARECEVACEVTRYPCTLSGAYRVSAEEDIFLCMVEVEQRSNSARRYRASIAGESGSENEGREC